MSDIKKIKVGNTDYNIKDETARNSISTIGDTKVDKVAGKGLSEEDFTSALKTKLNNLENYDDTDVLEAIEEINGKIPNQATTTNQLADKEFVNSSVATATATFRGTYNTLAELEAVTTKDLNDYGFVKVMDTTQPDQVKEYKRYKYNGTAWVYEYSLNNSSFTAAQWATINSGLTSTSLNNYYTKTQVDSELDGKVDVVSGKQLSTEDYTTVEKTKLAGLQNYDDTDVKADISDLQEDKQDISTLDTDIEALGYLKQHQSLDNYYTKTEVDAELDDKQDALVSGTNIKTINNNSILGSGNIEIQGGSESVKTYTDLQDIIDDATAGDTIYLNGTFKYDSTVDTITKITIDKNLNIIGEDCIIDGDNSAAGIYMTTSSINIDNCIFQNCYRNDSMGASISMTYSADKNNINGCTFINCNGKVGGIYIVGKNNTISNCNFYDCSTSINGVVCIEVSGQQKSYVTNCNFYNCNSSSSNGVIYIKSGSYNYISDCTFTNCTSKYDGGVIDTGSNYYNSILRCNFINCKCTSDNYNGGAIRVQGDYILVSDCNFNACSSGTRTGLGGGIYVAFADNVVINNCIFDSCVSSGNGGAIYFKNSNDCIVSNCEFKTATDTVYGVTPTYTKQDTLISGTNIKTINNTSLLGSGDITISGGGSSDYTDLENKPQINGVTLSGNKSTSDLEISYDDLEDKPTIPTVPTNVSAFTNDAGYLTSHQDISGKENTSNKSTNITTDTGSTTKYPCVDAVEDYVESKLGDIETLLEELL